jgi:hypothetical protein
MYGERVEHIQDFLHNTARAYLNRCDETVRRMLALLSAPAMQFGLNALLERMEHEVQLRAQHDLGVCEDGLDELRRMLQGPAQEEPEKVFCSVEDIRFEVVQRYVSTRFATRLAQWQSDMQMLQDAVQWYQALTEEQKQQALAALHAVMPRNDPDVPRSLQAVSVAELTANVPRPETSTSKASLKKALKLFGRMGKEQDVRMLVAGHEVTLSHPDSPFKFVLKAHSGDWLHRRTDEPGHGSPFSIHLLTKDDVHLAQLCVYFDKTPVLDQLLALTMFVESGQEKLILEKANWFGVSDLEDASVDGAQSRRMVVNVLQQAAPELLPRIGYDTTGEPLCRISASAGGLRVAGHFFEEQAHWEPYKGPVKTWLQTLLSQRGLQFQHIVTHDFLQELDAPEFSAA